eukprot:COSAG05_NODE_588_length_8503_cov_54.867563_4_plen_92_part_01
MNLNVSWTQAFLIYYVTYQFARFFKHLYINYVRQTKERDSEAVRADTARATAGEDTESRYQRRRRLLNNARWGKDGKWAKMADTLESVPVLG